MLETFTRSDTVPLRHKLERRADSNAWGVPNFVGATVRLKVYDARGVLLLVRDGAFEDVASGIVRVARFANDFAGTGTASIGYEHEVTFSDGAVQSFPNGVRNPALLVD